MRFLITFFLLLHLEGNMQPIPVGAILPKGQLSVHDPVIINQDSLY